MAGVASAVNSNSTTTIRIVVAGDCGTGKSSLIVTAAAAKAFPANVPPVLPPTRLAKDMFPDHVSINVIDTPSSMENRSGLADELKSADVVVLTYACDKPSTRDRLSTFWLPELRRLEVSGCIGGLFLKYPQFQTHGGGAIQHALLKTVPDVQTFNLTDDDLFIVLGSKGFWDHASNEEVVKMVAKNKQSEGTIAKMLIAEARSAAARNMEEKMATSLEAGEVEGNMILHDDMSVVVLFFQQDLDSASVSLKSFAPGEPTRSRFDEFLPHARVVNVFTARGEPSGEARSSTDNWAEQLG